MFHARAAKNWKNLREVLTKCKWPTQALDRMEHDNFQQKKPNTINNYNTEPYNRTKGYIATQPYMKGLSMWEY